MKSLKLSLRSKIVGLVLFVVATLSVPTYLVESKFVQEFEARVKDTLQGESEKLTEAISAQLFERYGDVQAFAVNETVATLNSNKLADALDSYIALYGIYDVILVVDKDGKFVGSNTKDPAGNSVDFAKLKTVDFSKQEWFQNTLAGKFTTDKENNYNGTFIEDFVFDPTVEAAFGKAKLGTSFSAQIKDSKGDVIGVITNRAGSRWFEGELSILHKRLAQNISNKTHVHLFNGSGKMVAHSFYSDKTGEQSFNLSPDTILTATLEDANKELAAAARKDQKGLLEYNDPEVNLNVMGVFAKSNDSKAIKSLGWMALIEVSEDAAFAKVRQLAMIGNIVLVASIFLGLLLAVWVGIVISKSISQVTQVLAVNSDEVSEASQKIASGATELSESATEQAAALQETVAAVDQISAMVEKNAEAAQKSREVSQQSREATNRGREIVSNMIHAIQEIDHSNDEVTHQMDESNRQLSEITKLINDISTKTKVINEIVFQTKLLSFNASVEAARAGEYGKGFAVVAEEVGNLAQMSGNAAKEITGLLEESVHKVNSIVNETKSKVDRLMASSKEKVANGSKTAQDCTVALDEIMSQVQTVDSLVSEIAIASQEQSTGIREVSKAIGQMEQVTQQNTAVSQSSSVAAEQLSAQSSVLNSLVKDLAVIVSGDESMLGENQLQSSQPAFQRDPKTASVDQHKVVKFKPVRLAGPEHKSAPLKKASGSDFVPDGNDPGFSE